MKAKTKKFHLGDILGVTTDIACYPNSFGGVCKLLHFMTGEDPFTHQAGRFADECKPYLLEQHKWLAEIQASDLKGEDNPQKMAALVAKYGEMHSVRPIHSEDHQVIDPQVEMAINHPEIEVVPLDLSDFDER